MDPRLTALLSQLTRVERARPKELLDSLSISKATLSRLVGAAGADVVRMGRGRATSYARSRRVEPLGTSLPVFRVTESGSTTSEGGLHLLVGGRHWLARAGGTGEYFQGLPPVLVDMAPQGYLGRGFPARYPELRLPARIVDWSDDHRLAALALRGEDCPGDLVVGDEALARFLGSTAALVERADFVRLAEESARVGAGSSAGGEHPKFGAFVEGRHVLVKFASAERSQLARRWRDLLWCEGRALQLLAQVGLAAPRAQCLDVQGWRFLEVERFDRIGARGRRGLVSLGALDDEYFGRRDTWTAAAERLVASPRFRLPAEDARQVRWLDAFGQLIGNTDRHFGNLSFFAPAEGPLRLAPAYDMLPMVLAPSGTALVDRPFTPAPPTGANLDVWPSAADAALRYWELLEAEASLHPSVRAFARAAHGQLGELVRRAGASRPRVV